MNIFTNLDKLFLSKEKDQEVYLNDIGSLARHELDCIRFQYLQYKKKHPGIIINVSSGFDNCILTAYFLKAIQHLLKKPILIISSEDLLCKWDECFQNIGIDTAVASLNPLLKKSIFINSSSNLGSFAVREWSVIVVHENSTPKEILQTDLKSDFRIWITSLNIKENLDTLFTVYNWLTKENIETKQFLPDKGNLCDVIRKAFILDTFLEDVYHQCFETNIHIEAPVAIANKVTKKNKDSTGTKIKRSKRILHDDDLPEVPNENKRLDIEENIKRNQDLQTKTAHTVDINYLRNGRSTNDTEFVNLQIDEKHENKKDINKINFVNNDNEDENLKSKFVSTTGNNSLCNEQKLDSEYSMVLRYDCSSTHQTQDIVEIENNPTLSSSNNFSLSENALCSEDIHLKYDHSSPMNVIQEVAKHYNFMVEETPEAQSKNVFFHEQLADNECKQQLSEENLMVKETQEQLRDSNTKNAKNISPTREVKNQTLDSKLLELEEMALKGSVLDSMF